MKPSQDQQHLHHLKNITFTPIFILGLHRSRTSILYNMLAATECFNTVTAYHLIHYDELLSHHHQQQEHTKKQVLTQTLKTQGMNDRGIDKLRITADFAEEYGFLLGKHTLQMKLIPKNLPLFTELMKKITYLSNNNKPILLKNPYDFSNFMYIKHVLPQAQFIFIHRHPYKTLSSSIKALRFLLQKKNPYTTLLFRLYTQLLRRPLLLRCLRSWFTTFYPLGIAFLTLYTAKATRSYLHHIHQLAPQDYIEITYEDLCNTPQQTIQTIIDFLQIQPKQSFAPASFIQPRKTSIDPGVVHLHKLIAWCMKPYFTKFQYTTTVPETT